MTDQELVAYYQSLLAVQYYAQPNAVATIGALATEVVASQIYSQVLNGFNLETAIGAQLDILAQYVGAPRTVFGYDPSIPYFAFPGYGDVLIPNTGFGFYADVVVPPDFWLLYTTSATTFVLSDSQLRSLIAYLIATHKSDYTLSDIDLILQTFFGTYVTLTDNENMTITYTHQLSDPYLLFSIINQLGKLPHPAGVAIAVIEV